MCAPGPFHQLRPKKCSRLALRRRSLALLKLAIRTREPKSARVGGRQHVLLVVKGARHRGVAEVTRGHGDAWTVNWQSKSDITQH